MRVLEWTEWRGSFDGRPAMFIKRLIAAFGCRLDIHKFVRADDPGCFHTHPAWAVRIIVAGGYVEELGDGRLAVWRAGSVGIVAPSLEHRIDRLRNGRSSWSIWIRGPKTADVNIRGC